MTVSYKILGQTGDASTEQLLYTVPAATEAKVRVTVANRSGSSATYRIAIVQNGGSTGNEDYVAYDKTIDANDSVTSIEYTLSTTDMVRVTSSTATVTFKAFGAEKT